MKRIKLNMIAHTLSLFTIGASIVILGSMSAELKYFFSDIESMKNCTRIIEPIPVEVETKEVQLPVTIHQIDAREAHIAEAKRMMAEQMNTYSQYEIALMAKVVRAEAGNQDNVGKRLVADVIMNRVDSLMFPNTVEEVVMQKNQFAMYDWYTIDDLNAVTDEIVDRTDKEILFFKVGGYHNIGEPAYQYGDHYFSTVKEDK